MPDTYSTEPKYIVVVGASAGGLHSIIELTAQLTTAMDLSVFVALHLNKSSFTDIILHRMQRGTPFTCKMATHGEAVQSRHLYLAPPDRHLVLEKGRMVLGDGPPENRWRPSIDVLFRSAAAVYDGRSIGIILTGLMQDGTAGMVAIQRSNGITIVQDPAQAEYPDMPQAVLAAIEPDYCLPLEQMGAVLLEKSRIEPAPLKPVPKDVKAEAAIAAQVATGIPVVQALGNRSNYVCPDCGGGLWEMIGENMVRYRCYTGHAFTQNELLLRQSGELENTLWIALRMLEERKNLLEKMSEEEAGRGWHRGAALRRERAAELDSHVARLKDILIQSKLEDDGDIALGA